MAIGIDVGRSGVKVAYSNSEGEVATLVIPSAFAAAGRLSNPVAVAKAERDTVDLDGRLYWFGETALTQARDEMTAGLDDRWVTGVKHAVLLKGAVKRLKDAGVDTRDQVVVVGLPSRGFGDNHRAYLARAMELVPAARVMVVPQALGPYYHHLFDEVGQEALGVSDMSMAIVEIGQYTTDFARIDQMVPVEDTLDSTDGMRTVAEDLIRAVARESALQISLPEATAALATGKVKNFAQYIDVSHLVHELSEPLAQKITDKIRQIFGDDLRTVDRLLIAGGGAPILKAHLLSRLPMAEIEEDARFAVARGFYRAGLASEAMAETAA